MPKFNSFRSVILAGVCLAPLMALAQQDQDAQNQISVGTRYQTQSSPIFGRYDGQIGKGFSSTGDLLVQGGDAWNSGKADYYRLVGSDLDYQAGGKLGPEASVDLQYGRRGAWGLDVYYNAISYAGNTIYTPFQSTGLLVAGIPAYGAGGKLSPFYSSANATALANGQSVASLLVQQDTGLRRDIFGGSAKYLYSNWTFSAEARHEHKEGTLEETTYGFVSNAAFPVPVNYDSDKYVAKLGYAVANLQGQLAFTYSKFTDNNAGITLQSPYFAATAPTQQSTLYSSPPSNQAFYVNGSVGVMLSPESRVTGNFRYGLEMQDAQVPAITGAGGLSVTPAGALNLPTAGYLALNPSSLSALARVYGANAAFDTTLVDHLTFRLSYALDGRDVDTSSYAIYGSGTAGNSISSLVGYSMPQSWLKQKLNAEASYRILPNTKLTVGYTFNDIDRSFSQVDHSTENVAAVKLASAVPSWNLDGSAAYSHSDRSAVANIGVPWTFAAGETAQAAAASYPSLVFYQAPRIQDAAKLRANYHGIADIDIGVVGQYTENRYTGPAGVVGTNNDRNASIGPDIGYSPSQNAAYHLFYTYEEIYYDNRGAGAPYAVNGYGWTAATTDSVHTVGLSADWKISDSLKFGLDYAFYTGDVSYYLWDGIVSSAKTTYSWQNVQNLPDVTSSMHSLAAHGQYDFTSNIGVWLGYQYNMFKDKDWAYSAWSPVTRTSLTANTILSGVAQPADHVNVIMSKLLVRF